MFQPSDPSKRVINHKTMRVIIGLIAFLMPFVVVMLSGRPWKDMSSISISYWTDSRDIFVGSLVAVAFFLLAYNGTGTCRRDMEYYLSKAACLFAVLVAFFPTTGFCPGQDIPPKWIASVSGFIFTIPKIVHYASAVSLFFCLMLMLSFFSLRAKHKNKLRRANVYFGLSLGMFFGMPLVYAIGKYSTLYEPVFWVEVAGLLLFGVGWLIAGSYKSKKDPPLPATAVLKGSFSVDPARLNVPTSIKVKTGDEYLFIAKGCWKDWFLECGPNGWGPNWDIITGRNRLKGKALFHLCGNIGQNDSFAFGIGERTTWEVPPFDTKQQKDQELYLFANDWLTRYGNNHELSSKEGGPMKVEIYKL
jgi:hypothetical protein